MIIVVHPRPADSRSAGAFRCHRGPDGHNDVTTFQRTYRLNPVVTETAGIMDDIWGNDDAA